MVRVEDDLHSCRQDDRRSACARLLRAREGDRKGAGAKVVLGPGLHSGSFTGKDQPGKAVTGSFTC